MLFAEVSHRGGLEGNSASFDIKRKNIRTQQFFSKILVTEEITIVKGAFCQHLGHSFCSRFPLGHFCNEFSGRFGVVFVADFFGPTGPSVDGLVLGLPH